MDSPKSASRSCPKGLDLRAVAWRMIDVSIRSEARARSGRRLCRHVSRVSGSSDRRRIAGGGARRRRGLPGRSDCRTHRRERIAPRGPSPREGVAEPSSAIAAKAVFYTAAREAGLLSAKALARRLDLAETEARRLLDPRHETRLSRLDGYLRALGWRMRIEAVSDDA
jgi:hypothetical protein